ncbi:MAG TPA: hypothetical protein VK892_11035 [Pyrinomonadaceae bacterium]|nr:hypothetical protein [Pyrinomonadaceae bacterium]
MKRDSNENQEVSQTGGQDKAASKRTINRAFCLLCEKEVELKNFEETAGILKTDFGEVLALAETGQIHRLHNARGRVAICAESLFDLLEKRPTLRFTIDVFKTTPSSSNIFKEIRR